MGLAPGPTAGGIPGGSCARRFAKMANCVYGVSVSPPPTGRLPTQGSLIQYRTQPPSSHGSFPGCRRCESEDAKKQVQEQISEVIQQNTLLVYRFENNVFCWGGLLGAGAAPSTPPPTLYKRLKSIFPSFPAEKRPTAGKPVFKSR